MLSSAVAHMEHAHVRVPTVRLQWSVRRGLHISYLGWWRGSWAQDWHGWGVKADTHGGLLNDPQPFHTALCCQWLRKRMPRSHALSLSMLSSLSPSLPGQAQLACRMLSAAAAVADTPPVVAPLQTRSAIAYCAPYQQHRNVPWAKPLGDPRSIRPGSFTASFKALHGDPRLVAVQPLSE